MLTHQTFPSEGAPPFHLPGVTSARFGELRVHAVRSGFVACKEAHRTLAVPDVLRLPAIVMGRRWTEWMPVYLFAVVHPEGVWLVDGPLSWFPFAQLREACAGSRPAARLPWSTSASSPAATRPSPRRSAARWRCC
jgi:hypothetical protein